MNHFSYNYYFIDRLSDVFLNKNKRIILLLLFYSVLSCLSEHFQQKQSVRMMAVMDFILVNNCYLNTVSRDSSQ